MCIYYLNGLKMCWTNDPQGAFLLLEHFIYKFENGLEYLMRAKLIQWPQMEIPLANFLAVVHKSLKSICGWIFFEESSLLLQFELNIKFTIIVKMCIFYCR